MAVGAHVLVLKKKKKKEKRCLASPDFVQCAGALKSDSKLDISKYPCQPVP